MIREATRDDLPAIVHLISDDDLGKQREGELKDYEQAFTQIKADPHFSLQIWDQEGEIIGLYQIMFLPHISFKGSMRAQIESVRIKKDLRGQGLGSKLISHAIELARKKGCKIFQLTSNKTRVEANKFYRNFGLEPSHDGYKLFL